MVNGVDFAGRTEGKLTESTFYQHSFGLKRANRAASSSTRVDSPNTGPADADGSKTETLTPETEPDPEAVASPPIDFLLFFLAGSCDILIDFCYRCDARQHR
jgi:hypothetical protein